MELEVETCILFFAKNWWIVLFSQAPSSWCFFLLLFWHHHLAQLMTFFLKHQNGLKDQLPPWKLTCLTKRDSFKRKIAFQSSFKHIRHCHLKTKKSKPVTLGKFLSLNGGFIQIFVIFHSKCLEFHDPIWKSMASNHQLDLVAHGS